MKITAAVFRRPDTPPTLEQLELSGPRDGEVLVRMVATGVCHTDLKAASSGSPVPFPVVLGHEGAGVVEAVGDGVDTVSPGDHVVMSFGSCGHCPSCQDGEPAYCHNVNPFACTRADGSTYLSSDAGPVNGDFFAQSSFATYAIGTARSVAKVPKDAPLELLGPLGCGIQTGAGAILRDLKVKPGQTVGIFGVGALGLSAVMAARIAGAGRIIGIDRHAHRLALARELGATDTILAGNESLTEQVKALVPIGLDAILDTTGVLPVMRQAIDALAPRGACAFVTGPWDGSELGISVRHLLAGRRIQGVSEGNSNPAVFIPQLVDFFLQGRFPIDRLVKFYEFDQLAQAFHDSEEGLTVKPILRIG